MEERESLLPFIEDNESRLPCDLNEEPESGERRDSTSARSFSPTDELPARAASTWGVIRLYISRKMNVFHYIFLLTIVALEIHWYLLTMT